MGSSDLTLLEILDKYKFPSDKHTSHSYIPHLYEDLFKDRRESCKRLLEIGVQRGGSLRLWEKYFPNADIYGIDNGKSKHFKPVDEGRIKTIVTDAYKLDLGLPKFDVIIDDGPHDLSSQAMSLSLYLKRLKEYGIMIIEDVRDLNDFEVLRRIATALCPMSIVDLYDGREKSKNNADKACVVLT